MPSKILKQKQSHIFDFFQITTKTKQKEEDEEMIASPTEILSDSNIFHMNHQRLLDYMDRHGGISNFLIFENPKIQTILHTFVREIDHDDASIDRLFNEFVLIDRNDFFDVFLQVKEILSLTSGYPHIIRGSAGCSYVCYLMEITNIHPIRENIPLTRFMHERRTDIPDIDIDFPYHVRNHIFEKIYQRWEGRVARISNHIRFKEKSALKEAIRRRGYHKFIPKEFDIQDIFDDPAIQYELQEEAEHLVGEFRCYSLHCGGIIIFQDKVPDEYYLKDYCVEKEKKDKSRMGAQLKLNKDEAEDFHLIKIDILSNRGLSQLWQISQLPIENYPYDPQVYKLFEEGRTIGLTYAESRGMCKIFREMKPKSLDDIACALGLIRPAASRNGQKFTFLRDYYQMGIAQRDDFLIYDDDAIQKIATLLHITHSEADIYRKAFAKNRFHIKKQFKLLLDEHQREHMTAEKRQLIFEQLECLQEYSFCKSHAFSYAKLVYALAYQKYYQPVEFWKSTLQHCNSSYRTWVHYREAKHVGVDIQRFQKHKTSKNQLIQSFTPTQEFFRLGYWTSDEFLPNMHLTSLGLRDVPTSSRSKKKQETEDEEDDDQEEEETTSKKKKSKQLPYVQFRGIIATYKVFQTDKYIKKREQDPELKKNKFVTFVTLGYQDAKYIDIVLWGMYKLSKVQCISGEGFLEDENTSPWVRVKRMNFDRLTT